MKAESAIEVLNYVKRFSGSTLMVKLGGAALEDTELVRSLCDDFALMRAAGISLVLVHGGGPSITRELESNGIQFEFREGLRVTTPEMMDIIEMVLCGKINRRIVRTLNAAGVKTIGMSGTDTRMFQCTRMDPTLGEVGQIQSIHTELIEEVLDSQKESQKGVIPVVAPIGVSSAGEALNVNADWAACKLAQALGIRKLIYMTSEDGVLDQNGKLLSELDAGELVDLIQSGVVKGGMLAKANTILEAIESGVQEVHIINAKRPHSLIEELYTDQGIGTVCRAQTRVGGE